MMTYRENYLRAVRFERPEYIPMNFSINAACWKHYPQRELFDLMEAHKLLFPDFVRPKGEFTPEYALVARKNQPYRDDFGCVWTTADDGITGTVTGHPLSDWDDFAAYVPPDPEKVMGIGPVDWEAEKRRVEADKKAGRLVHRGLRHGHTFLQLSDIRGYQNLMYDMADGEEKLFKLIGIVERFNLAIVEKYAAMGVDVLGYGEDLGMQRGPMVSPAHFREYIQPVYRRLIAPARAAGAIIHMHSDGDLHDLIDDIMLSGVEIINLQDLVNGVDWIAARFAGKTCVELDIDRQKITYGGTPEMIDALIREEVSKIGRKEGGLMMVYGLYPGVPLENAAALMDAMEKYVFYFNG